jgi:hypothetical protein
LPFIWITWCSLRVTAAFNPIYIYICIYIYIIVQFIWINWCSLTITAAFSPLYIWYLEVQLNELMLSNITATFSPIYIVSCRSIESLDALQQLQQLSARYILYHAVQLNHLMLSNSYSSLQPDIYCIMQFNWITWFSLTVTAAFSPIYIVSWSSNEWNDAL